MSIVFSKNKEKRPRSSSSEANNSFVKNVTSRVSGLLPATISRWFSSPSSSTANGSAQTDNTDSSTEDEAPESPVIMQPPAKRMRYSPPGKYHLYSEVDSIYVPTNMDTLDTRSPYSTGPWTRRTDLRRETNFISTSIQSTLEEPSDRTESDSPACKTQHTVSSSGSSVATKRKSLFDFPSNSEDSLRACTKTANNTMKDPNRPCFKPSLLGSPFYPGRTMYGGASASYINQPNIVQTKTAQVNETNNIDNTISHSAKRVMDLLEHYSSPLSEARRLPPYVSNARNYSFNKTLDSSKNTSRNTSYKLQELHIPSIASILRLKKRSRLMDTTKAARQIIASHSSTSDYQQNYNAHRESDTECTYRNNTNKLTTKVKSKVVQSSRAERSNVEYDMPEPVNLPSAVLQIDNLPKFTLGSFDTSHTLGSSTPRITNSKTKSSESQFTFKPPEHPSSKPVIASVDPYKFSNPVQISSATNPSAFVFSSPERSIDKLRVDNKDNEVPCVVGPRKEKKTSNWTCPDCWVSNKPEVEQCVCCTAKKPTQDSDKSQTKKVSFEAMTSVKPNNVSQPLQIKPLEVSKWKCKDCWVENAASETKCVCCGYKREDAPKITPKSAFAKVSDSACDSASKSASESKSESANADWKCDVCWIKNKSSVEKCVACGGARPKTKLNTAIPSSTPISKPDDLFKNMLNTQNNKWECPNCLVRNESNKTKCACCETEKPGSTKDAGNKSFNFGINPTFRFGIDPNLNKPVKSIEAAKVETNNVADPKTKLSETNNNVLNETPTFTFSLPTKKAEDQTDAAKKASVEKEPPKMNFIFGLPKSATAATPATEANFIPKPALIFGIPSKPAERTKPEENERPQEVPTVDLSIPNTLESSKTVPDMLKFTSTSIPSNSTSFANPLVNSSSSEKKDSPAPSFTLPGTTTEDKPKPAMTFSFSGIKVSSNLFSTPTTAAVASAGLSGISFTTAASTSASSTTTAASCVLFQLPATTASTSIFPKTEAPTNTTSVFKTDAPATPISATPTPGTSTSVFGFGTNAQTTLNSNVNQPDKPSFNFTFGSDSTKAFGSEVPKTFGAEPDKTINFSIDANKSFNSESKTDNQWSFKNSFGGNTPLLDTGNNGLSNNVLGGNGLSSGSNGLPISTGTMPGGNGLMPGGNILGTSGLNVTANNLNATGNTLPNSGFLSNNLPLGTNTDITNSANMLNNNATGSGVFGLAAPNDNIWPKNNNNSSNRFVPNTTANSMQKQVAFTFGSSTAFNNSQPVQFGAAVGSTNMFGSGQTTQSGLFSAAATSPPAPVFGSPQPSAGMFGSPAPAFATPKLTFEQAPAQATPTPAFNFGSTQQSAPVFGFGQQQQSPQQAGMYNFGGAQSVQFNMGSAPNKVLRPFRKAVRRTRPR